MVGEMGGGEAGGRKRERIRGGGVRLGGLYGFREGVEGFTIWVEMCIGEGKTKPQCLYKVQVYGSS